jgi:hypothetical protein
MQGVSGPGPYSKRTDLAYKPDAYGDGVAMQQQMSGAPLAEARKAPLLSEAPVVPTGGAQASVTGLYEPTQRPDEPITHGVDIGPGGGSDVLAVPAQVQSQYTNAYDVFQTMASNPNASPTMKYLAQRIQLGF